MADAATAGDRSGFRGGFGDRGKQVKAKSVFSKPNLYSFLQNKSFHLYIHREGRGRGDRSRSRGDRGRGRGRGKEEKVRKDH